MGLTAPTLAPESQTISGAREPTGKGFGPSWLNLSRFYSRFPDPHMSTGSHLGYVLLGSGKDLHGWQGTPSTTTEQLWSGTDLSEVLGTYTRFFLPRRTVWP